MEKFCPNCGAGLAAGVKFCASCGAKFAVEPPPPPVEPTPTENIPQQQQYVQPMPMQPPRKSNAKIIAVVAVIVVAVVVCAAVFFMLQGGNALIGKWNLVSVDDVAPQAGFSTSIEFFTNGSFTTTSSSYGTETIYWGSYEIKGDQICGTIYGGESECSSYSFSNGNRRLTIITSDDTLVLEKV